MSYLRGWRCRGKGGDVSNSFGLAKQQKDLHGSYLHCHRFPTQMSFVHCSDQFQRKIQYEFTNLCCSVTNNSYCSSYLGQCCHLPKVLCRNRQIRPSRHQLGAPDSTPSSSPKKTTSVLELRFVIVRVHDKVDQGTCRFAWTPIAPI